jgi:hypothetical protein
VWCGVAHAREQTLAFLANICGSYAYNIAVFLFILIAAYNVDTALEVQRVHGVFVARCARQPPASNGGRPHVAGGALLKEIK